MTNHEHYLRGIEAAIKHLEETQETSNALVSLKDFKHDQANQSPDQRDYEREYLELCNKVRLYLAARSGRKAAWLREKLAEEVEKIENRIL